MTRLQLVAETEAEMAALLALFFKLAKKLVATMENSLDTSNFTQWREAAHSLKGSSANLGMSALEEICRESEKCASFSREDRTALLMQVKDEIRNIHSYITRENPSLLRPEA